MPINALQLFCLRYQPQIKAAVNKLLVHYAHSVNDGSYISLMIIRAIQSHRSAFYICFQGARAAPMLHALTGIRVQEGGKNEIFTRHSRHYRWHENKAIYEDFPPLRKLDDSRPLFR